MKGGASFRSWLTLLLLVQCRDISASESQVRLGAEGSASSSRPNIVFILTDDQDLHMQSLEYIPLIKKHLIDHGTLYKRHFCTTAVCCPSRVSLWTGKAAHNTNVTDVFPPYGTFN
jgi:arylsulfatase A-like enzyme